MHKRQTTLPPAGWVGLSEDQGLNSSDIQSQFGFATKDRPQAKIGNGDQPWEPGPAT